MELASPKISVLMTVYNGMPCLAKAVQGLLNQTYKGFELVVVDDGSTDSSLTYLHSLSDSRIRVIQAGRLGRGKALNLGLKHCKGEYVAINDADDFSSAIRLKKQSDFLDDNPGIGLVGSWKAVVMFSERRVQEMPITDADIRRYFCIAQPIQHSTVMMRTKLITQIGGYNENIPFLLDRDIFLRMAKITKLHQLSDVLVDIHRSHSQFFLNNYNGFTRERKSLQYRIKAINQFGFPKWWILRELIRSCWNLTPTQIRKAFSHFIKGISLFLNKL